MKTTQVLAILTSTDTNTLKTKSMEQNPVEFNEISDAYYKLEIENPPEWFTTKEFVYYHDKVLFPISSYNLEVSEAVQVAVHYKGTILEVDHAFYIDADSAIRFMESFGEENYDDVKVILKDLAKTSEKQVQEYEMMKGLDNGETTIN